MKLRTLAAATLIAATGSANAAIVFGDDWELDLSSFGYGSHLAIDEANFSGIFNSVATDNNGNGFPDVGDTQVIDGLISVTGFTIGGLENQIEDSAGGVLGVNYQVTGQFDAGQLVTSFDPVSGLTGATHNGQPGTLNLYFDDISGGGTFADTANASTYTDGTLIATFDLLGGFSSFNQQALDGQDDTTWQMLTNDVGALKDKTGVAVVPGETLAIADSNTDADPDQNGQLDTAFGAFPGQCEPNNQLDVCGTENGSFNIGTQIPAPGTLMLLGAGLVMAGYRHVGGRKKA